MYTYSQEKIGFNYFYHKCKVLEDGISIIPFDICLSPWSHKVRLIESCKIHFLNCLLVKLFGMMKHFPHVFVLQNNGNIMNKRKC